MECPGNRLHEIAIIGIERRSCDSSNADLNAVRQKFSDLARRQDREQGLNQLLLVFQEGNQRNEPLIQIKFLQRPLVTRAQLHASATGLVTRQRQMQTKGSMLAVVSGASCCVARDRRGVGARDKVFGEVT